MPNAIVNLKISGNKVAPVATPDHHSDGKDGNDFEIDSRFQVIHQQTSVSNNDLSSEMVHN